jgi:hypothetical protein
MVSVPIDERAYEEIREDLTPMALIKKPDAVVEMISAVPEA